MSSLRRKAEVVFGRAPPLPDAAAALAGRAAERGDVAGARGDALAGRFGGAACTRGESARGLAHASLPDALHEGGMYPGLRRRCVSMCFWMDCSVRLERGL